MTCDVMAATEVQTEELQELVSIQAAYMYMHLLQSVA